MNQPVSDDSRPVILIVDDDRTVVLSLHKVLSRLGSTRFAMSGKEAFELIEACRPGLILLDYELPGMSGKEICACLKQNPETTRIPVLFVTSHNEPGIEEELFDAGAADYISKPLNPLMVAARAQIHLAYYLALQRLDAQAHIDGLTGLANRRSFDEHLNEEWKRACRHGRFLTLLMIDIDEFKKYNDHFGHQTGDECLKRVAQALREGTRRPTDLAARYGGEEFAVILAETEHDGAAVIAEMLRSSVEQLLLDHAPQAAHRHVTISIGLATLTPEIAAGSCLDETALIKAADQGLYESKHNGRNRFTSVPLVARPAGDV